MKKNILFGTLAMAFAVVAGANFAQAKPVNYGELSLAQQAQYKKISDPANNQQIVKNLFFKNVYEPSTSYAAPQGIDGKSYTEMHKEINGK